MKCEWKVQKLLVGEKEHNYAKNGNGIGVGVDGQRLWISGEYRCFASAEKRAQAHTPTACFAHP